MEIERQEDSDDDDKKRSRRTSNRTTDATPPPLDISRIGALVKERRELGATRDTEMDRLRSLYDKETARILDGYKEAKTRVKRELEEIKPRIFSALRQKARTELVAYMDHWETTCGYRFYAGGYSHSAQSVNVYDNRTPPGSNIDGIKRRGRRPECAIITRSPSSQKSSQSAVPSLLCIVLGTESLLCLGIFRELGLMELFNVYRTCRFLRILLCRHLEPLVIELVSRDTKHQALDGSFGDYLARLACLLIDYNKEREMPGNTGDDTAYRVVPRILQAAYLMHRDYRLYGQLTLCYHTNEALFINIHNSFLQETDATTGRVVFVPLASCDLFHSHHYKTVLRAVLKRYEEACGGDSFSIENEQLKFDRNTQISQIKTNPLAYFMAEDWHALHLCPLDDDEARRCVYTPDSLFILQRATNTIRKIGNSSRGTACNVACVFQINGADGRYDTEDYSSSDDDEDDEEEALEWLRQSDGKKPAVYQKFRDIKEKALDTPINACSLDRYELRLAVLGVRLYEDPKYLLTPCATLSTAWRQAASRLDRALGIEEPLKTVKPPAKKSSITKKRLGTGGVQRPLKASHAGPCIVWREGKFHMKWPDEMVIGSPPAPRLPVRPIAKVLSKQSVKPLFKRRGRKCQKMTTGPSLSS